MSKHPPELVEKVADAMWHSYHKAETWWMATDDTKRKYKNAAIAALDAMHASAGARGEGPVLPEPRHVAAAMINLWQDKYRGDVDDLRGAIERLIVVERENGKRSASRHAIDTDGADCHHAGAEGGRRGTSQE